MAFYRYMFEDGSKGCCYAVSGAQAAREAARRRFGDRAVVEGFLFTGVKPGLGGTVRERHWAARAVLMPTLHEEIWELKRTVGVNLTVAEDAKAKPVVSWRSMGQRPADRL